MRADLANDLKSKYGKILPKNVIIECGDGWYTILDSLLNSIVGYIRNHNVKLRVEIQVVKQKFGLLRIQYGFKDIQDMRVDGMFRAIQDLSAHICESCGSPTAKLQNGVVRQVLCKSCLKAGFIK